MKFQMIRSQEADKKGPQSTETRGVEELLRNSLVRCAILNSYPYSSRRAAPVSGWRGSSVPNEWDPHAGDDMVGHDKVDSACRKLKTRSTRLSIL